MIGVPFWDMSREVWTDKIKGESKKKRSQSWNQKISPEEKSQLQEKAIKRF
jgi:hypothetical protein